MANKQEFIRLGQTEKQELLEKIEGSNLDIETKMLVLGLLETLDKVCGTLEQKRASLLKIQNILGFKTEKSPAAATNSKLHDSKPVKKKGLKSQMGRMGGISPLLSRKF